MKKIAIISDIHANVPALKSVLEDINKRGIDLTICLGDLAGKGPSSAEAVDLVKENCNYIIKGNWDYNLTEKDSDKINWYQKQLGKERLTFMKELPIYMEFFISGKLLRLCHASPNDLFHRTHLRSDLDERLKLFEPTKTLNIEADIIGYGDIHHAYVEYLYGKTIFNTGSVGHPMEIPQASYAIIEGEYESKTEAPLTISIARIPYDIDQAVSDAELSDMLDKKPYINELQTAIYRNRKITT